MPFKCDFHHAFHRTASFPGLCIRRTTHLAWMLPRIERCIDTMWFDWRTPEANGYSDGIDARSQICRLDSYASASMVERVWLYIHGLSQSLSFDLKPGHRALIRGIR